MLLLEAVVWIGIFAFTMVTLSVSIAYFYRINRYIVEAQSAVIAGQQGIDAMVKTLREASYASNGAYPIVSIGQNQITFYSDIKGDLLIEKVNYYLSGTYLYQDTIEPSGNPPSYGIASSTVLIADYTRNIAQGVNAFTYYDKNGAQIVDYSKIGDVRFITINLIVDVSPNAQPGQLTLRSSAALRNLVAH